MSEQSNGRLLSVLHDDTHQISDKSAQEHNITAARAVANAVRSTLGPKGMDKMLVDDVGNISVTNDGVTILRQMDVENPTANLLIEVAGTQESEAGDGTTTAVVLAGALLQHAEDLLEQGLHPTALIRGFNFAEGQALERVDQMAERVDPHDERVLREVATTSMTGRGTESHKEHLAELVVDAISAVTVVDDEGRGSADAEYVHVETQEGRGIAESELLQGGVLDAEPLNDDMPRKVDDARILLLDQPIEFEESAADVRIDVDDPSRIQDFLDQEQRQFREQIRAIEESGANVVFCQKGIEDLAARLLSKKGILAAQQVKTEDISFLKNVLDATIVTELDDLSEDDLGVGSVRWDTEPGQGTKTAKLFYVESETEGSHGVTLLLRGSTGNVVEEVERSVEDALNVVTQTINDGRVLPGGGATETELSSWVRDYADTIDSREQLAAEAYADALESIPRTLATNAGLDPIDTLIDLRAAHDAGQVNAGLDVFTGDVVDTVESGVVEPAHAKRQTISSATEAANLVLKIDDIIAAGDLSELATKGKQDDEDPEPGREEPGETMRGMGDPGSMGSMGGMGGAM